MAYVNEGYGTNYVPKSTGKKSGGNPPKLPSPASVAGAGSYTPRAGMLFKKKNSGNLPYNTNVGPPPVTPVPLPNAPTLGTPVYPWLQPQRPGPVGVQPGPQPGRAPFPWEPGYIPAWLRSTAPAGPPAPSAITPNRPASAYTGPSPASLGVVFPQQPTQPFGQQRSTPVRSQTGLPPYMPAQYPGVTAPYAPVAPQAPSTPKPPVIFPPGGPIPLNASTVSNTTGPTTPTVPGARRISNVPTGIGQSLAPTQLGGLGIDPALYNAWVTQVPANQPWPGQANFGNGAQPKAYGLPNGPANAVEAATMLANGVAPDVVNFTPVDLLQWGINPGEYYRMLEKLGYKQVAAGVFVAVGNGQGSNDFASFQTPGTGGGSGGWGSSGGSRWKGGGGGGGGRGGEGGEDERSRFMYAGEGQQQAQYNTWEGNQQAGYSSGLTRWRI